MNLINNPLVKYNGRNRFYDNKVIFENSCSGFEISFFGKELKAVFDRLDPSRMGKEKELDKTPIAFRVYVDGVSNKVIWLDESTDNKEITLISFANEEEHLVEIRKVSNDERGFAVLKELSGPTKLFKINSNRKKILFIGDSITVGYGTWFPFKGEPGDANDYKKEDGTLSYASLLANHYHADYQEQCSSGISLGVIAWKKRTWIMNELWTKYSYYDYDDQYDMNQFIPDLIIVNLGTNDVCGLMDKGSDYGNGRGIYKEFTKGDFKDAAVSLIKQIRKYYKESKILFTYGMMGNCEDINESYLDAIRITGDKKSWYKELRPVECNETAGHPTLDGQKDGFEQLKEFIDSNNLL